MNSKKFSLSLLAFTLLAGASTAFANEDQAFESQDSEEISQVVDESDCSCCDHSEEATEE
jgi:hypothetical protein